MPNDEFSGNQVEIFLAHESNNEHIQDLTECQEFVTYADTVDMEAVELASEASEQFFSELKPMLTLLQKKMDSLSEQVDFGLKFADKKISGQIDKLYEENRMYKENLVEQFKKKLVLGVIEQLDVADKQISLFETREESEKNYKNLLQAFREITDDFREMLKNRLDIIPFQSSPGDEFNATRHNALGTIPDGNRDKDKTIARSKRHGYVNHDGKILRTELVEVFYFDPSLATPEVTTPSFLPPEGTENHTET